MKHQNKKDLILFVIKLKERSDSSEGYCKSYLKKKTQKTIEIKNYRKPNIVDIKSVIKEHPKNLHKLSRAIRQAKNISNVSGANENSDIPLKSETKKVKFFRVKKMKRKKNHLMLIKVKQVLIVSKFLSSFISELSAEILNMQLEIT